MALSDGESLPACMLSCPRYASLGSPFCCLGDEADRDRLRSVSPPSNCSLEGRPRDSSAKEGRLIPELLILATLAHIMHATRTPSGLMVVDDSTRYTHCIPRSLDVETNV